MVILHTNHGDITLELDAENAPDDRRELPAVRARRPLRQHDLPSRHRRLHDPGRRHGARHEAEADARADRERGGQRAQEQASTRSRWRARREPHSATAQFFINVADNEFLDHKGPSPQGWGYCVFGKVVARPGCRRQDQGRDDRQQRFPPERPDGRRRHHAGRGSQHKADAVPVRPASVAGAAGAGGGVRRVLRGSRARCVRRLRAGRPVRCSGSATTSCASRSRRTSPRRCAACPTPACRSASSSAIATFFWARGSPTQPARTFCRSRSSSTSPARPRVLLHGDELCTSDVGYQRFRCDRSTRVAACVSRAAVFRAPRASRNWLRSRSRARDGDESRSRSWTSSRPPSTPRSATAKVWRG